MNADHAILAFAQRKMCEGADILLAIIVSSERDKSVVGAMSAFCRQGREGRAAEHIGQLAPDVFPPHIADAVFETGEPAHFVLNGRYILLMRVG